MAAILRLAKSRPFAFGMGYSLFKTSGCDLMVQKVVEKRENIDWNRNLAFASFGLFYLGGVQYLLYVPIFGRIFPNAASFAGKTLAEKAADPAGVRNVLYQVFLDQFVHHPLMYFPVFYMIKDFVSQPDKPDPVGAVKQYQVNMKEDLCALWKVWIPSTLLNFSFMPMWGRIPWVASTSLIWTCILSAMRGGSDVPATNVYVGVDASTMELVTRTVVGPAPKLDPTQSHVLLVAKGPDRPGIISSLTQRLYEHGATVTTSKMLSLGDEFAILMHASVPPEKLSALQSGIGGNTRLRKGMTGEMLSTASDGLQISIKTVKPSVDTATPSFVGKVWLTGADQTGLLYRLSQVLAEQQLNIEHLQTELHMPSQDGAPQLFSAHCHVCSDVGQPPPNIQQVKAHLKELEQQLGVKCALEEVFVMR